MLSLLGLVLIISHLGYSDAKRPNIIMILSDDLGWNDLHFPTNFTNDMLSPNLDQMAREGLFLTNSYMMPVSLFGICYIVSGGNGEGISNLRKMRQNEKNKSDHF